MKKNNDLSFKAFKEEALKDEAFREAYEVLRPEFELVLDFIRARKKKKISQAELAKRLKAQQPTIARLEKGGYASTSVPKLVQYADAMGYTFKWSLQAKKRN